MIARCLALMMLVGCATVRVVPLPREAEPHRVSTSDHYGLAVIHYAPMGNVSGPPVVLAHGISANARNLDLDERHSLARWLSLHGRDVWLVSWRGTGDSDSPDLAKGRGPISFDDFWKRDLPAVIDFVKVKTGAPELDFVGHSMGGMIVYAYLSQGGQGVRRVATLGTPTRLDWGSAMSTLAGAVGPLLPRGWDLPSAAGSALLSPISTWASDTQLHRLFYHPTSTTPETFQRLLVYGTANTSTGVALQLLPLMTRGAFLSADGAIDFKRDMARILTPVLVVAGAFDRLAVTPAVHDGYLALGGPKTWVLIGRANGSVGEYGHMDLVIGERAADEVWPTVLDFLNRASPQELPHETATLSPPAR